ncbi:MAG: DUF2135 domain-containing protein [Azonexus sp.]|jgi:uncharacterized protein YfaP (DUF2135 family)|nr:DUF2135 domain-containing protein [Azonexus sp.]
MNGTAADCFRQQAMRFMPWLASALILALLPIPALAELEMPISGWRIGDPDTPFTQPVNYPLSRPNLGANVPDSAQIRGRIRSADKKTATLIVNGNPMPVRLDESGAFARPYSFGAGSNSVEAMAGETGEKSRRQFYQTLNGQAVARLRVILAWDSDGTDIDLHVITPSGEHAWYGQRVIKSGALDIDVTDGYGPEIFASPAPEQGLYQVYVNFYGSGDNDSLTTVRLSVMTNESTASEKRQEFTVPMRIPGELTLVRQFMYP